MSASYDDGMSRPEERPLLRFWLNGPGMREPARVAKALGHHLPASMERLRDQVTEEELATWLRGALGR